jgi:hypothetical protein
LRASVKTPTIRDGGSLGEHTASSPLFEQSARDIVARLDGDPSEVGRAMAREARELVTTFAGWVNQRPEPEVRISAIQRLFELNRRAMDHLAARGDKTSSPPPSNPGSSRR